MGEDSRSRLSAWLDEGGRTALDIAMAEASDIVAIVDRDHEIRYINYTAQDFTKEGVIGLSVLDIAPPNYRKTAQDAYAHVFETGTPTNYEVMFNDETRLRIWDVRLGPIRIEGEVIGAVAINHEVSEQRRQSVERDRFFLLSLDMLAVASPDGRFTGVNPALAHALGYEVTELLERQFIDLVHPDDRARTHQAFQSLLCGEPVMGFENRYRCKDATYRVFSWRATLDPVTAKVYAVARDVTEQRSTEEQLRHAQKMEAIGQLAGGVAHDFNNLMLAILANAELALADEEGMLKAADHLKEIHEAGERAAALTKQLLAFSRQRPIRPVGVDLNALIDGLMNLLRRLLPENIALEFVAGQKLAPVSADPSQVEQVVVNLCVNARDAMADGGQLRVETENVLLDERYCESHPWAAPGRYVLLSVTDTGAGMTRETRERAFEPFYTTKPAHQGTGLGLSTVYGIVRQHEGMVHLYSELGRGTTRARWTPGVGTDPATASRNARALRERLR